LEKQFNDRIVYLKQTTDLWLKNSKVVSDELRQLNEKFENVKKDNDSKFE
jgi:hypothetical protein